MSAISTTMVFISAGRTSSTISEWKPGALLGWRVCQSGLSFTRVRWKVGSARSKCSAVRNSGKKCVNFSFQTVRRTPPVVKASCESSSNGLQRWSTRPVRGLTVNWIPTPSTLSSRPAREW